MSIKVYDGNDKKISTNRMFLVLDEHQRRLWKKLIFSKNYFYIALLPSGEYQININNFFDNFLEQFIVDCSNFQLKKVITPDCDVEINDIKIH